MGFIPERWLDYVSIGKPIKDVPIIVCKTPLQDTFNRSNSSRSNNPLLEEDQEFTPSQLVDKVKEQGKELAVVIDLTNTFRYYDGPYEFFEQHKVHYVKIKCEGQRVPSDGVFNRLADVISDVIYQHGKDGKKICAIHCTHGVNRAGYLVARYMIEYLGYDPEEAIKAFNESRLHDIEREGYIKDLKERTPKNYYKEWEDNRKRYDPHANIDFDDWNQSLNSFDKSKEEFFNEIGFESGQLQGHWSQFTRYKRYSPYQRHGGDQNRGRGRGRGRRGTWSRFYNGYKERRQQEKFSDDNSYMPDTESFVLDQPLTDQLSG